MLTKKIATRYRLCNILHAFRIILSIASNSMFNFIFVSNRNIKFYIKVFYILLLNLII